MKINYVLMFILYSRMSLGERMDSKSRAELRNRHQSQAKTIHFKKNPTSYQKIEWFETVTGACFATLVWRVQNSQI